MRKRILLATLTACAVHAAPGQASCVDAVEWRGQLYTNHGDLPARPGPALADRARLPGRCGPVTIDVGGKRPTPLKPDVVRWGVVHSIQGVLPTVAVLRDGKVYRNRSPLQAPPAPGWLFTP